MNDDRVIPITVDNRYVNEIEKTLDFSLKGGFVILEQPGNYNIIIDKMTLPISNVPIGLNVLHEIYFDSLDKVNKPTKFAGGDVKMFPFIATYSSLYEFVEKLNNHFDEILEEYNFMKFAVTTVNGQLVISYTERIQNYMKVWVGEELRRILDELSVFNSIYISNSKFYQIDGAKGIDYTYTQTASPVELICTLQKFKIYSDLPTSNHYSYDMLTSSIKADNLLTDIDYNPQTMIGNKTIKYLPTVLREYSLRESTPINNFRLWFTAYHSNGNEDYINLNAGMYSSINIRFLKKLI